MKYYRIKCEIYKAAGKSWERMAEELLLSAVRGEGKEHGGKVVRLVFFTFCEDNREYQLQRSFLEQWVDDHFVSPRPVLSLVAQKPLVGELVMEVHSLPATAGEEVTVEEQMTSSVRYLRVTSGHYREIIAGGLYADDLTLPVREQSEQVFGKAEEILKAEQMSFGIWNASRILCTAISVIRILMIYVRSFMLLRNGLPDIRQPQESGRSMVEY